MHTKTGNIFHCLFIFTDFTIFFWKNQYPVNENISAEYADSSEKNVMTGGVIYVGQMPQAQLSDIRNQG